MKQLVIDSSIVEEVNNKLTPLYNSLTSFQNEINKASILVDLNLDSGNVLFNTNKLIRNELESLEKIRNLVDDRVKAVSDLDTIVADKLEEYYESLSDVSISTDLPES